MLSVVGIAVLKSQKKDVDGSVQARHSLQNTPTVCISSPLSCIPSMFQISWKDAQIYQHQVSPMSSEHHTPHDTEVSHVLVHMHICRPVKKWWTRLCIQKHRMLEVLHVKRIDNFTIIKSFVCCTESIGIASFGSNRTLWQKTRKHTHTDAQNNYHTSCCACMPRVNQLKLETWDK